MNNSHRQQGLFFRWHIDLPLFLSLLLLLGAGLFILYSATGESFDITSKQAMRGLMALGIMVFLAQLPPAFYTRWAPPVFMIGIILLILVLAVGHVGMGAQRWLNIGLFRFQPSEIFKFTMPMMLAAWFSRHPLPPKLWHLAVALVILLVPTLLIAKQPDLGTALLIASSGVFVILFSGIRWRLILVAVAGVAAFAPVQWFFLMHDYQRERILTFLDPERDPLGTGYHIIQSKIAIGSGGLLGKGWLHGTQSQLEFLPERHTDFIFAVLGEEFGLVGICTLLFIYLLIISRGLYIATQAQSTFERLLAGSITLTFFVYVFVNIGMVSGLLPVVGVPLPLVSYGGTSMVTLLAGFGILMSIHTHRRLLKK